MGKTSHNFDFLVVGAGIFGACTAVELALKNYKVGIINPDEIPHPFAASTDISKIVRMEYGSDGEYMDMAIAAMSAWKEYNKVLREDIYHEVGYLVLTRNSLDDPSTYEGASLKNLRSRGLDPEILNQEAIARRFPSFNPQSFSGGFYHKTGGYAYSGRAVELLVSFSQKLGVKVFSGQTAQELMMKGNKVEGVKTAEGHIFHAGQIIMCAGNSSPYLIPELKPFMKVTGHPVFHLKPTDPELYKVPLSAAFAADISNTGWYGFPFHPHEKVVKIANHGPGLELDPYTDPRTVTSEDERNLRLFLQNSIPSLAKDKIVYTRRCCYTDTLDGHFWIDNHPEKENLTIGTGGSGHGFKMGPEVGKMIAAKALGDQHAWSSRYKWRELSPNTIPEEEARKSIVNPFQKL